MSGTPAWQGLLSLVSPGLLALFLCGCSTPAPEKIATLPLGPAHEFQFEADHSGPRVEAVVARSPYVAIVWVNRSADVFAAVSADDGVTFAPAQKLSTPERRVAVGTPLTAAFIPGATRTAPPIAFVAWTGKGSRGSVLEAARAVDGGGRFEPLDLSGDLPAAPCGGPTLTTSAAGRLFLTWNGCAERSLVTASLDRDGRVQHLARVPADPPGCVRAVLSADASDGLHLVWPGVAPDGTMTLQMAVSRDGARSFGPASRFGRETALPECRDMAGTMVIDETDAIHISWSTPTDTDSRGQLFYLGSRGGTTLAPPQTLNTDGAGVPSHPRMLFSALEGLVVAWDERVDTGSRVVLRQLIPAHHGPAQMLPPIVLSRAPTAQRPFLASIRGGVIVAWTSGEGSESAVTVRRVGLDAVCAPEPTALGIKAS